MAAARMTAHFKALTLAAACLTTWAALLLNVR